MTLYAEPTGWNPNYHLYWPTIYQVTADGVLQSTPFVVPIGKILVLTDMGVNYNGSSTVGGASIGIAPVAGGTTNYLTRLSTPPGNAHVTFVSGFTFSSKARPIVMANMFALTTLTGYLVPDRPAYLLQQSDNQVVKSNLRDSRCP